MRGNIGNVGFTRWPGLMPWPYGARASVSSTFKQRENLFRCDRHEGFEVVGHDAQAFDQVGEDLGDARQLVGIFGERERRGRDDVLVGRVERLPDGFERAIERELFHLSGDARGQRGEGLAQRDVEGIAAAGRGRDGPFEVSRRHREHAAGQVAEVVGQVRVVAIDHALFGKVAVEAVGEFAQDEKPQHVGAVGLLVGDRIAGVAGALRQARAAEIQEAVDVEMTEERQADRQQHRGPVDGVRLQDVLADEVLGHRQNFLQ